MKGLVPKAQLFLKRNSATILTYVSVAGVIATAIISAKVTPKAIELLHSEEKKKGEKLTKAEAVKIAGPAYIPPVIVCVSTISCILGANVLNKQKQAALTSAYALLNSSYKEYRKTLIDLHGEEADIEVRNAMARQHCDFHQLNLDTPDAKVTFYDEFSGEFIQRYEREIMDAEYHLNRNFTMRGYTCLNEFYEFLGLPRTDYGDEIGWTMSYGYSWIDFEHRLVENEDGTFFYAIDMVFPPDTDYLEDWS